jgi:predicted metalloprotease with PDZ domain
MTRRVGAALAVVLVLAAASAAAQAPPQITAVLAPSAMDGAAGTADVRVTLTVPGMRVDSGQVLAQLPLMIPGGSRPQAVAEVVASDAAGTIPAMFSMQGGTFRIRAARTVNGTVTIRYRLPIQNSVPLAGGPPLDLRVDGVGVSGVADRFIMAPAVPGNHRIRIEWDLSEAGPGTSGVTSYGDGNVDLPAGPVTELLNRTLMMAGRVNRFDSGAFSAVWTGDPGFDPRPAMQWTAQMHKAMSVFFRDETEPPYRVFLRFNPMNAGGGAAMTHSFIVTYGTGVTGENIKSILGHEMTHTWTANGLDKWYAEGDAVFYQALLPWRAGLITTEQFLADLNKTASRYYTNAMKATPEAEVGPRFWEDTRIRVLPYDRGAMYFAVLNGKIRKASQGKRSVDDLIHAMIARGRAGQVISDSVWLDLLRKELGADGPATHASMMSGGLMLPESDGFGPCFRRTVKKIREFDVGFSFTSLVGAEKKITGLKPGSEAAKAGIRDGDVINYATGLDALQGDTARMFTVQVTRDGKTFPVTYLPRGNAVDAYQWERVPGVPESRCK